MSRTLPEGTVVRKEESYLDVDTGEIVPAQYHFSIPACVAFFIGIPQPKKPPKEPFYQIMKTLDPCTMITRIPDAGVRGFLFDLTMFIGFENNFVMSTGLNMPMQLTEMQKIFGLSRMTLYRYLNTLEGLNYIKRVKFGKTCFVYVYSHFAWRGYTDNKSDKILSDFLQFVSQGSLMSN
jgi:hypothetical protein